MVLLSERRGVRNNNPLNIERGEDWEGLSAIQADSRFAQFDDPRYGIRAAVRIFRSYRNRGINTLRGIVSTWAPASENNTDSYVRSVAYNTNIEPDEVVSDEDYTRIIAAMIKHENGVQPYSMELINQGIALA